MLGFSLILLAWGKGLDVLSVPSRTIYLLINPGWSHKLGASLEHVHPNVRGLSVSFYWHRLTNPKLGEENSREISKTLTLKREWAFWFPKSHLSFAGLFLCISATCLHLSDVICGVCNFSTATCHTPDFFLHFNYLTGKENEPDQDL